MSDVLPAHPRTVVRNALVSLLAAAGFPGAVYANREEPWDARELPVCGVYATSEAKLETDQSPRPDERRLTVQADVLTRAGKRVDDSMDALSFLVERALTFPALEAKITAMAPTLPLLDMQHTGTEMAIADAGDRLLGVASLTFDVDYRMPEDPGALDKFITGDAGWDICDYGGPDGRLEAEDIITLPQTEE